MNIDLLRRIWNLLSQIKNLTTIAVIGLLIYGYNALMNPTVNPHPIKKVVVRGKFPYDKGWELRIQQSFYAKNPSCNQTARIFFFIPQAEVSRERFLPPAAVKRLDASSYETEYFEDYFLPGFCEWVPYFTSYRIFSGEKLIQGGAMLGFPNLYNRIDYGCSSIKMPRTNELATACYEGNNRSFDPSRKDGEINFFWKGNTK